VHFKQKMALDKAVLAQTYPS